MRRYFSIAPMMGYTDRHFRYIARTLTKHTVLYTEMLTCQALLYSKQADSLLAYNPVEHPIALQIAGCDPCLLAKCAIIAQQKGYDEVNFNLGCPSKSAEKGNMGVVMMRDINCIVECVLAMKEGISIPLSVKCRLGLENYQPDVLHNLVDHLAKIGCGTVIVHARAAILGKISTSQNRRIPPLDYDAVYQLKKAFPKLEIILNGGIQHLEKFVALIKHEKIIDGIMVGRAICKMPQLLARIDSLFFDDERQNIETKDLIRKVCKYLETEMEGGGVRVDRITRHLAPLIRTTPHAKKWKLWLTSKTKDLHINEIKTVLAGEIAPLIMLAK